MGVAACVLLAGCGGVSNHRALGLKDVPLPRGAQILARVRVCDRGANAFCAEQLVVTGGRGRYASSADLLNSENARLKQLGWSDARGNTGKQLAAQPPVPGSPTAPPDGSCAVPCVSPSARRLHPAARLGSGGGRGDHLHRGQGGARRPAERHDRARQRAFRYNVAVRDFDFTHSSAGVWILEQNLPRLGLRVSIHPSHGDDMINVITIQLSADYTQSVIGGWAFLCQGQARRDNQHQCHKRFPHERN